MTCFSRLQRLSCWAVSWVKDKAVLPRPLCRLVHFSHGQKASDRESPKGMALVHSIGVPRDVGQVHTWLVWDTGVDFSGWPAPKLYSLPMLKDIMTSRLTFWRSHTMPIHPVYRGHLTPQVSNDNSDWFWVRQWLTPTEPQSHSTKSKVVWEWGPHSPHVVYPLQLRQPPIFHIWLLIFKNNKGNNNQHKRTMDLTSTRPFVYRATNGNISYCKAGR